MEARNNTVSFWIRLIENLPQTRPNMLPEGMKWGAQKKLLNTIKILYIRLYINLKDVNPHASQYELTVKMMTKMRY